MQYTLIVYEGRISFLRPSVFKAHLIENLVMHEQIEIKTLAVILTS